MCGRVSSARLTFPTRSIPNQASSLAQIIGKLQLEPNMESVWDDQWQRATFASEK